MNLLQTFKSLNLDKLKEYASEGQEENLNLEFKCINSPDLHSPDDKKNFAKALSGFANSSGGIIIWGIETKKKDGIDCASGLKRISPLKKFITRLNEFTGVATSPIVEGVLHKPIPLSPKSDWGFAATFVPESISGPHMAKFSEDRYYKRSGHSFYKMEHFDLEDMFGRRKKPELDLSLRYEDSGYETKIILGIKNTGRGTAKAPYLAFSVPRPFSLSVYGLTGSLYSEGLPRLNHAGQKLPHRYGANSTFVIHPGTVLEVAKLEIPFGDGYKKSVDLSQDRYQIEYEISAEDMQILKSEVYVTKKDIFGSGEE